MQSKYYLFWGGICSQWAKSPFTAKGLSFNCCEQWMMWHKAMLFKDYEAATEIMKTKNPKKQKAIGRRVKNFDAAAWEAVAYDIVVEGNRHKFQQNPHMLTELLSIDKEIVEASPYDRIWGIGLAAHDSRAQDKSQWRGKNLLGQAIMEVQAELRENASAN